MSVRTGCFHLRRAVQIGVVGATLAGCATKPVALTQVPTGVPLPTSFIPSAAPSAMPDIRLMATAAPTPTRLPTAQPTQPAAALELTPTILDSTLRKQVFDEVWNLVSEKYLYPDFNGLDWQAIYTQYAPQVANARSNDEFYAEVAEMIALLNDHHSRFLPPAVAASEDTANRGEEVTVGIGVLVAFDRGNGYVRTVFPGSPAAQAGIRPRDRVIAIDGRPYTADDGDMQGANGSVVRLNIQPPGEKPQDVILVRQEVQGRISPTYERLYGDIGYIAIPTLWVNDMDAQVSGAVTELVAAGPMSGMIIDLRGNGGGWGHVLSGILGHFVRGPVGTFFDQKHSRVLNVTAPAGPDVRNLPLVVLIDRDTQSYAEVLASILQENGAKVVGTTSAGNTESVYVYAMRDGSRLWLAQENFKLRNGTNLEGSGVQPNAVVDVDWKRYSESDDPQILEALRLLGAGPK